jgi:hypothetical protein
MYITAVLPKTTTGKIAHRCILLRESYREDGKVKTRTLANLTHGPPQDIAALRWVLHQKDDLLSPEESARLLERLEGDAWRADDRSLLVQVLRVMHAAPKPLDHGGQPAPQAAQGPAQRARTVGKPSRRRRRR